MQRLVLQRGKMEYLCGIEGIIDTDDDEEGESQSNLTYIWRNESTLQEDSEQSGTIEDDWRGLENNEIISESEFITKAEQYLGNSKSYNIEWIKNTSSEREKKFDSLKQKQIQ